MANIVQFLVSTHISVEENLYVLLVATILAVPLFTVADIHYGSGTRRNICGRKKPVVAESGNIQCESVSSSKENGMTLSVVLHFCVLGGDHYSLALCILHSHSLMHPTLACLSTELHVYLNDSGKRLYCILVCCTCSNLYIV